MSGSESGETPDEVAIEDDSEGAEVDLEFYGGSLAALVMGLVFLAGMVYIVWIGAAGATSFWAVGVLTLAVGMVFARSYDAYSEAVLDGMGRQMTGVMVAAWIFAGILGTVLTRANTPGALIYVASLFGEAATGRVFVVLTFFICSIIATSIGTSAGTIAAAGPVLFPAGVLLGANPILMAGAILGGAAFGDDYAPISDTTIVCAYTQETDIAGCVRSRLKYVLVAAALATVLYVVVPAPALAGGGGDVTVSQAFAEFSKPGALPMLIPAFLVIALAMYGLHLISVLVIGDIVAIVFAVGLGLVPPSGIVSFEDVIGGNPSGAVIQGIQGLTGIIIFTFIIMGIYGVLEHGGVIEALTTGIRERLTSVRSAEFSIIGMTLLVNAFTAHNTVTDVSLGEVVKEVGEEYDISAYRRANLLDITSNTIMHTLPYMITPLLLVGVLQPVTEQFPVTVPSPAQFMLYNFHSWMLLVVALGAVATGFGRTWATDDTGDWWGPSEEEVGVAAGD